LIISIARVFVGMNEVLILYVTNSFFHFFIDRRDNHSWAGTLPVGENIVVIAVASGHRDGAFHACCFSRDELKRMTPIGRRKERRTGRSGWRSIRENGGKITT